MPQRPMRHRVTSCVTPLEWPVMVLVPVLEPQTIRRRKATSILHPLFSILVFDLKLPRHDSNVESPGSEPGALADSATGQNKSGPARTRTEIPTVQESGPPIRRQAHAHKK